MKPIVPFVHSLTDSLAQAWAEALANAAPALDIRAAADMTEAERDAVEVAIVANPDPAALADFPNLKWVQSLWAGVERILKEMPGDDIQIARLVDPQLAETMGEAVLSWTLYLHRDMPRYAKQQAQRAWVQHDLPTAAERTVGVLGLGHLGQKSVQRLQGNGFNVVGWSRSAKDLPGVTTYDGADGLAQLAALADIVVVLLPSTPQTRGLLGQRFFDGMKRGGALINFARGDIIDNPALLQALDSGQMDHAVLDVFPVEPLPDADPFWTHPDVTVLPHISAPTNKTTASAIVAQNLNTYFATGQMPDTVSRKAGY
ncbi:2-hydroxyacid dehydrogenase [Pararhodobacter oceanensis]|uniref:Glyoxylate/hydroxypyruvate reductase A n=1 Tax=Pararhodobacter oceanensis TaxID=2172121 RepID=A0A2T8HZ88_9RHOB|nr:glyoxylate/hydroxypyruvate reductase A [Pararhodobacter oceanensis]PVH30744.1 glyoxylate/hydroxypyruvate reductase A [Pararhodobacter oceanensis]